MWRLLRYTALRNPNKQRKHESILTVQTLTYCCITCVLFYLQIVIILEVNKIKHELAAFGPPIIKDTVFLQY